MTRWLLYTEKQDGEGLVERHTYGLTSSYSAANMAGIDLAEEAFASDQSQLLYTVLPLEDLPSDTRR